MENAKSTEVTLSDFIERLPKVELHLHIEGTLEPEMLIALAKRNGVEIPYRSIEAARNAYHFDDLKSFLNVYYLGASVLREDRDYHELTIAYLSRCKAERILHAEIFFDPQTHLANGVALEAVIGGIHAALLDAERDWGISSALILCFERDRDPATAVKLLERACALGNITGIGLDSAELDNPPGKFQTVFAAAKAMGLHRVAHAGEEGPPSYIWQALDMLQVERIDHGVRCLEDPSLVRRLIDDRIPLTVCPFSNIALKVFPQLSKHNLGELLAAGLLATINSDDPAYFGGYLSENMLHTFSNLNLPVRDALLLQRNAVEAAFCSDQRKQELLSALNEYNASHHVLL
ncbi:adenosine deaminase [Acidithiobacillus sulfuriphilus]|uniref:adenosine deaminase n=1 Tax=Acidithiobacillus sulfuriphilus TaxID=1867749 RepID=UPI003F63DA05